MLSAKIREMVMEARDRAADRGLVASIQLHSENSHLMRIGNNSVSLNTSEALTRLDIEVISGRKKGTHTNMGTIAGSEELFQMILAVAEKAENSGIMDYKPVLPVIERNIHKSDQYDPLLENLDPSAKEQVYSGIIAGCGKNYNYSGSWSSGSTETFLVTTANRNTAHILLTDQQFTCVLKHPDRMWELADWQTGWKAGDVTVEKAVSSFKELLPVYENNEGLRVEPGSYKVVLGSQAVGDLLGMAVWTGCAGRTWEMKMGWTAGNSIGDEILHRSVTIMDDPGDENVFSNPLSDSGMITKPVPMVENGKLASLMYDRNTASMYGKEATPNAGCLVMAPGHGPESVAEAVKNQQTVLYIPAIHYMNMPNMSRGIFTGSSRFSAVLLKNGKVAGPIFSSRITDSFQNIFGKILDMSARAVSVNTSSTYGRRNPTAVSVPSWLLVDDVKITDCADSF